MNDVRPLSLAPSAPQPDSVRGLTQLLIHFLNWFSRIRYPYWLFCNWRACRCAPGDVAARRRKFAKFGYYGLRSFLCTPLNGFHRLALKLQKRLKGRPRLNITLGTLLIWFVVGGLLAAFDPFGLNRASHEYTRMLMNRFYAPRYQSAAQERIVVVLIDDATLQAQKYGAWPPSYDFYAAILYRILAQNPRAVFVDIMLERPRERDRASLAEARETLGYLVPKKRIPVILGQSRPGARNLFGDIPGVETAPVTWKGSAYPLRVEDGGAGALTAAPRLYAAMCTEADIRAHACKGGVDARSGPPMEVQWGCAISPTMRERGLLPDDDGLFVAPSLFARWKRSLSLALRSLFVGFDEGLVGRGREKWPYAITVMAGDLANAQVRGLLKDKAVLVGADVTGMNDLVATPVNGELPGVYVHAMALDNLLHYGGRYHTADAHEGGLFLFMGLCVATLSGLLLPRWRTAGYLYFLLVGVLVLALIRLSWVFDWAPQNWLGYLTLTWLAYKIQTATRKVSLIPRNRRSR